MIVDYEQKPTKENLIQSLKENCVNRNEYVLSFALMCCQNECGAIAIDAQWGDGKTFFVKQVKLLLDAYNPLLANEELDENERKTIRSVFQREGKDSVLEDNPVYSVYYDAWAYDSDLDPALSLAYELACATKSETELKGASTTKSYLQRIAKAFGKKDLFEAITQDGNNDFFEELKEVRRRDGLIREFIESILPERGNRLVVFIDELDRCNPAFAVKMLERIKHFFEIENVMFVFSINSLELQHTIKRFYGEDFDAIKYLNRFFVLKCPLPTVDKERIVIRQIGYDVSLFFKVAYSFCSKYDLSMRDIGRINSTLQLLRKKVGTIEKPFGEVAGLQYLQRTVVPIMVGLWVTDRNRYKDFVEGNDGEPFYEIIQDAKIVDCMYTLHCEANKDLENEQILKTIYQTVFGKDKKENVLTWGRYRFESSMRTNLMDMLSDLASE